MAIGSLALLTALAAVWMAAAPSRSQGSKRSRESRGWGALFALLAVAAGAVAAGTDLARLTTSSWVRTWNVYHYYLGSKYYEELGYHDLYAATLEADAEGLRWLCGVDRVRDLESYEKISRRQALLDFDPEAAFRPERWQEFRRDTAALLPRLPPETWATILSDRGYNGSPLWTTLGSALSHRLPAEKPGALKVLAALDLVLLGLTAGLLAWAFGPLRALLVLLLFFLCPFNQGRFAGGFLQYDWFYAGAAALALYHRGRAAAAGWAFAYAVMTRLFPLVFLLTAAVPLARRAWLRHRSGRPLGSAFGRREVRFAVAFGLACLAGLALGSLAGPGRGEGEPRFRPGAWVEFVENTREHSGHHRFGQRRIGLAHVFTHDLTSLDFDEDSRDRETNLKRQRPLLVVASLALLALLAAVLLRRRPLDAFLLGLVALFVLAVSSRYYWAFLALLPLVGGVGAADRRRRWLLVAGQAALFVMFYLAASELERYGTYVVVEIALALYLVAWLLSYWPSSLRPTSVSGGSSSERSPSNAETLC